MFSRACHHTSDAINHSCCPSHKMQLFSLFRPLSLYPYAQGGAEQKGKKHDAACANSFHGRILSHCWTFPCPMQFFGTHTVAGVHDLLFQAYFLILSSAPGALSVMYSLKILEKIQIFSLSQQKFLYDTYKGLQFDELQGSAH